MRELRSKLKTIVHVITATVLLALASAGIDARQHNRSGDVIARFVERRATREGGAANVIKIVEGDIDADGDSDAVASYGVEGIGGGNFTRLYIAVFINKRGRLSFTKQIAAGTTGTGDGRLLILEGIENNQIVCRTLEYLPDDGACCPSKEGRTVIHAVH